jgi:hypothetical protein
MTKPEARKIALMLSSQTLERFSASDELKSHVDGMGNTARKKVLNEVKGIADKLKVQSEKIRNPSQS